MPDADSTRRPPAVGHAWVTGWRSRAVVLAIGTGVVIVDQATKWWAEQSLAGRPPVQVVGELLQFTFVRNPGGAFSIGTDRTWLFSIIAIAVAVAIVWYAGRVTSGWWRTALGVLLGGAVGNLIDRFIQPPGPGMGHVVDFLQLPNWPVFNVADMELIAGMCLLMLAVHLSDRRAARAKAAEGAAHVS